MTAFNYARSRATAERLIAKFGKAGNIGRITNIGTAYDPTQSTTLFPCTLCEMTYSNSEIDGALVRRTDKKLYVSTQGLAITIAVSDFVQIAGVNYEIVNVTPLAPGDTVVFWEIQARN